MSPTVEEVLARRYPSFHEPLRLARRWNRSESAPDHASAARLLDELMRRYPAALPVWYEAAFNRRKDRPAALELLARVDRQFGGRLDEDTYSLWGRCYKDAGHERLEAALALPFGSSGRNAALEDADREYASALAQYLKGLELSQNAFPGVNVAFLEFMRAALASALSNPGAAKGLLDAAQRRAAGLLTGAEWPRKQPDDDVWHPATRGEANALLGRWDEAVRQYDLALRRPTRQAFHGRSMGSQLNRVLQGWGLLGQAAPADLGEKLPDLSEFLKPS